MTTPVALQRRVILLDANGNFPSGIKIQASAVFLFSCDSQYLTFGFVSGEQIPLRQGQGWTQAESFQLNSLSGGQAGEAVVILYGDTIPRGGATETLLDNSGVSLPATPIASAPSEGLVAVNGFNPNTGLNQANTGIIAAVAVAPAGLDVFASIDPVLGANLTEAGSDNENLLVTVLPRIGTRIKLKRVVIGCDGSAMGGTGGLVTLRVRILRGFTTVNGANAPGYSANLKPDVPTPPTPAPVDQYPAGALPATTPTVLYDALWVVGVDFAGYTVTIPPLTIDFAESQFSRVPEIVALDLLGVEVLDAKAAGSLTALNFTCGLYYTQEPL